MAMRGTQASTLTSPFSYDGCQLAYSLSSKTLKGKQNRLIINGETHLSDDYEVI